MSVFKVILTILLNVFILFLFFVFCFDFYAQIVLQDVTRQSARYSITRGRMGDLWFDPAANPLQDDLVIPSLFHLLDELNAINSNSSLTGNLAPAFCSGLSCSWTVLDFYRNLYLEGIDTNQNPEVTVPVHAWYAIGLANRLAVAQLGGAVSQYPCWVDNLLSGRQNQGLSRLDQTPGCLLCFARPSQQGCVANALGGDSIVISCIFNSGNAVTNFVRNLGGFFGADVRGLGILRAEFWAFYPSSLTNPCLRPGCG